MLDYQIHDLETAPEESKPLLQKSIDTSRMIPNLHGIMAESPQVLEGYQVLHELAKKTSFGRDELTVVWQCINVEHECHYCIPAHSMIAKLMRVDDEVNAAVRDQTPLPSDRLETLRSTTLAMVRNRGRLSQEEIEAFLDAGFDKRHLLEIVLILAQKVMSNYVNHLADTPVDEAFMAFA